MNSSLAVFRNHEPVACDRIPCLPVNDFRSVMISAIRAGRSLTALFGTPSDDGRILLIGVLADADTGGLFASSAEVNDSYPCLTLECPQAHWFEREIAEQWGVHPQRHPWLKPIRFHPPYRSRDGRSAPSQAGVTDFFAMRGEEVHEVAVGPVHAGIIEPGHFRFQCHGEEVFHLEISLGYQHRAVEPALLQGPDKRSIHMVETLSGDSSIGHAIAYCEAIEVLSGTAVPARAQVVRGIALELDAWQTIAETSARSRATSAICPPLRIAGVSGAIS